MEENDLENIVNRPELKISNPNINQENIQNINHQILEKDYGKKTNFISNKTKRHKNHLKAKGEGSNYINGKNKSSLSLKHVSKSLKIKNDYDTVSKNYEEINIQFEKYKNINIELNKEIENMKKEDIEDIEDSGVKNIDPSCFYRLVFKNFDITKYEYITGEDVTYIEGKNWVLTKEEEDRKKKWK